VEDIVAEEYEEDANKLVDEEENCIPRCCCLFARALSFIAISLSERELTKSIGNGEYRIVDCEERERRAIVEINTRRILGLLCLH